MKPTQQGGTGRPMLLGLLALWAVALLILTGCDKQEAEQPDLIVLHSGRLRGNVYPLELQANAPLQHYPSLAGAIRDVRKEAEKTGAEVLLIDLGDSFGGSFASHATDSANMVALFNALDYDAVALSNLDFGVSPETLSQLEAKVINPFADASGQPATEGTAFSTTLVKGDIPIRIIANFYGDTDSAEFPDRFPAWFGTTPGDVVPFREYETLPTDPGMEGGLSLLTWMKFESPDEPPVEFLEALESLGIDAVLAHRIYGGNQRDSWTEGGIINWEPPVSLNILRNNGGFALARLDLKRDGDTWKVLRQQLLPMTANTAPPDEKIVETIAEFREVIGEADAHLAELDAPMDQQDVLKAYMAALAKIPGSDAVLYSKQSIRTDWPEGPLTASRVFNSLPWTTPIVQMQMSRNQFDEAAELLGMEGLVRQGADDEEITVVTSSFFSRLIARKLGLPSEKIRPVAGAASEFDFFVESLTADPSLLTGTEPFWPEVAIPEVAVEGGE